MLYFGDGTPYIHHIYKNGLMDGQQKSWYNNGQLRMDAWYDMGFKRYQKDYDRDGKQVKTMFSKG
jgi:antitoxin component YwqK of YwqJK toxin-antitoxin module